MFKNTELYKQTMVYPYKEIILTKITLIKSSRDLLPKNANIVNTLHLRLVKVVILFVLDHNFLVCSKGFLKPKDSNGNPIFRTCPELVPINSGNYCEAFQMNCMEAY